MIKRLKQFLFPFLFLIVYLFLMGMVVFGNTALSDVGTTIVLQLTLSTLLLFSLLHRQQKNSQNMIYLTIGVALVISSVLVFSIRGYQYAFFVSGVHIILLFHAWQIFFHLWSIKKVHIRKIADIGGHTLALFFAVFYTLVLRNASTWLSFHCDDFRNQTIGLVTRYLPDLQWNSQVITSLQSIESVWSQSLGQLLGTENNITTGFMYTGDSLSGTLQSSGLLSSLLIKQQALIQWVVSNQELIDAKVCDLTLSHIQSVIDNEATKIVWFFLLVLLFWFLIGPVILIISIINCIILRILYKSWWFKKIKKTEECEELAS